MGNINKTKSAKKKTKRLSFEPVYHRRVDQGKYMSLPLRATKGASIAVLKAIISERDQILAQEFTIIEIVLESPVMSSE
jgi:hypothetical protein